MRADLRIVVLILVVIGFACCCSGCSVMGAYMGAKLDRDTLDYSLVDTDSLSSLAPGDTLRICKSEVKGVKYYDRTIFVDFDPEAGLIRGETRGKTVGYLVEEIVTVEQGQQGKLKHTGKIVGFTMGLAIDLMIITQMSDGWMDLDFSGDWGSGY